MKNKILFTPGPLTTSQSVKETMLVDMGSRDYEFKEIINSLQEKLLKIGNLQKNEGYEAIIMQGSGTFGVESVISSVIPSNGNLIVLNNGHYGERMIDIAKIYGINVIEYKLNENEPINPSVLDNLFQYHPKIDFLACVHCETTTGILNPINEVGKYAKKYGITIGDMSLVNGSGGEVKIKPGMVINIPRLANSRAIKIADSKKQYHNTKGARSNLAEDTIEKTPKSVKASKTDEIETEPKKSEKTAKITKPDNNQTSRKNYAANVAIKEQKKQPMHHVVKKGETLSEISNKYGIDVSTIKSANNIKAGMVYPNMKLKLVKHVQKKDKREKRTVKYHIVKKGETLTTISNKYGMDIAGIKSVNKLKTDVVHPNMKLRVNAS